MDPEADGRKEEGSGEMPAPQHRRRLHSARCWVPTSGLERVDEGGLRPRVVPPIGCFCLPWCPDEVCSPVVDNLQGCLVGN